jgi:hypothetical protein
MAKPRKSASKPTKHLKSSHSGSALSQKADRSSTAITGAILSQPSKASQAARRVERTFEAGVASALRIARAHGVAVTIQDKDGNLMRGVPRQRDGAFVIERAAAKDSGKGAAPSTKGGRERGRKR